MLLPAEGLETFLIILKSLPVLLHPQSNKRNKSKTMKIFLFLQKKKKKKKNRKKERKKISQRVAFKTSFTNNDNNWVFIQYWLHNYIYKKITYKLMLTETCFLTVICLILKWLISIFNEVIENVKGGLVSSCKIANLW